MSKVLYKKRATILKRLGLINVDLRKSLTTKEKRKISLLWNKDKSVYNNLDDYTVKRVSRKIAGVIDSDKLRIPRARGVDLFFFTPKKDGFKYLLIDDNNHVHIENDQYSEEIFPGGVNFFDGAIEAFNKPLGKHDYVTMKVGGNRPFSKVFKDINSLLNYAYQWQPNDPQYTKEQLINHISVVRIKDPKRKSHYEPTDLEQEDFINYEDFIDEEPKKIKRKKKTVKKAKKATVKNRGNRR